MELLTPDLDGSLGFFRDLLGMQETARAGGSVYLRGYEEQYHHSLKLTAAPQAGLGHVAWRSRSPQALERRVAAIEAAGLGRGWIDGDLGHGRAFRFETPEGHPMEIFWEVEYATTPEGRDGAAQPPAAPAGGRGAGAAHRPPEPDGGGHRRLPRLHGGRARLPRARAGDGRRRAGGRELAERDQPVARHRAGAGAHGRCAGASTTSASTTPRCSTCSTWRSSPARPASDRGGPGRHGIGGAAFLYLFEPGGNRIELMGDPGYMIFDPAWRTVVWDASEIATAVTWAGSPVPDSFWVYGTPPAESAAPSAAA